MPAPGSLPWQAVQTGPWHEVTEQGRGLVEQCTLRLAGPIQGLWDTSGPCLGCQQGTAFSFLCSPHRHQQQVGTFPDLVSEQSQPEYGSAHGHVSTELELGWQCTSARTQERSWLW